MKKAKVAIVQIVFLAGLVLMLAGCGTSEQDIYEEATPIVNQYIIDEGASMMDISEPEHTEITETEHGWNVQGTVWVNDNDGWEDYSVQYDLSMSDNGQGGWSSEIHFR